MSPNDRPATGRLLVLGAGELGSAMVRALVGSAQRPADVEVSVLLRPSALAGTDVDKQREIAELRGLGVVIEPGDIAGQSVAELADIFAGFDTVVSWVGFAAGSGTQLKLAHAALESGVRRYFPWQFGVDYDVIGRGSPQPLFDEQLDVRDLLRGQDRTEWVIVSTGMFTSFLFEPDFAVVDLAGRRVNALGGWDTAVTVTTPDDIGRLTAEIVYRQPAFVNEVVYLAGDTITYGELASLVEEIVGAPLTRNLWTVDALLTDLRSDPSDTMKKYRAVFSRGVGVAWDKAQTYNAQHGIDAETASDWASRNLNRAAR